MIYRFDSLFKWTSGKPNDLSGNMYPVYGSNGIIGFSNQYKFENKIIIGRVGAYCGSVMYEKSKFDASDNTLITKCNEDLILYGYAYYLLKQYKLNNFAGGAAQPLITQSILKKLKCDIPSIDAQNVVIHIIENYDLLIANIDKQISVLNNIIRCIYKEWFIAFRFPNYKDRKITNGVPFGWTYKKIGDVCDFIRGVSYTSDEIIQNDESIFMINLKNIKDYGGIRKDNYKYFNGVYKECQIVKKNDLVMAITEMVQERRIIGYTALIPSYNGKCVISSDLVKISSDIDNRFLFSMFTYGNYSRYISSFGNGTNVIHLKPGSIKNIKVLLPDNETINEFVRVTSKIFDYLDILEIKKENLLKQRDLLLPRLMSGKIEVK